VNSSSNEQIENDESEEHLVGIGVGIDLGTTNSAIAMMIPSTNNDDIDDSNTDNVSRYVYSYIGLSQSLTYIISNSKCSHLMSLFSFSLFYNTYINHRRTVPTMLSVDKSGSKTIPSVVSFTPISISSLSQSSKNELSLPPWTTTKEQSPLNLQWPNQYTIQIGNAAIQYETKHPKSTFRNVKRVIGTGGTMANLAIGVVPNLYIDSINGHAGSNSISGSGGGGVGGSGGVGGGNGELDILFNMLEDSDKSSKKKKGKKKKKQKNKWKKRKENELPKLHKQLVDAKDDPALLSCDMGSGEGGRVDDSGIVSSSGDGHDSTLEDKEILLRPEQISACILRHLYDTAEQYHRTSLNSNKDKEVKVTRAVIGVPAYFTEAQRQATIHASEIAGVSKVKLLPEPEAAALAYGSSTSPSSTNDIMYDNEELILVFDLGGGTFDVSILEVGGGITEVMATIGNNRLGGTDFDKRVAEYLCSCAVDFDRKLKNKNDKKDGGSLDGIDDIDKSRRQRSSKKRVVKDWYRHGSGEVPDIILRVAEEVRKCLSNQKVVEVVVPLTEDGWKQLGEESLNNSIIIGPPIDKTSLETEYNMIEDEDYTIISLDRTTFESICYNELQLLLQPIREVAIMAGVLLPGEARPSFVENAMLMAKEREEAMSVYNDGEDFWDFDDDDFEDKPLIKSTNTKLDTVSKEDDTINEQTMQQIQAMDIKSQKKAQQRGRKKARDIDKRERSFRKQKRSAMEEATTASLLGKQVDDNNKRNRGAGGNSLSSSQSTSSVSVGNEKVQEGIHGRPLSRIVLVGGATRMPVIAKLLEAVVGMVPQRTVHPDEAVALGCAVQVGILDGENEGLLSGMQAVLSPMQAAVMRALGE